MDHVNSTSYHEGKEIYISEPGLYQLELATVFLSRVIFSSRLKLADQFRSWVFEEVLPAIRGAGKLEASLRQELVLKDRAVDE